MRSSIAPAAKPAPERSLREWIPPLIIDDTFRFQSHLRHLARFGLEIDPCAPVNAYLVAPSAPGTTVYELTPDRLVAHRREQPPLARAQSQAVAERGRTLGPRRTPRHI